jgi:hypothetical protein
MLCVCFQEWQTFGQTQKLNQTCKKRNNPNLLHYTKLRSLENKRFLDQLWNFLTLAAWQFPITNISQATMWVKSR